MRWQARAHAQPIVRASVILAMVTLPFATARAAADQPVAASPAAAGTPATVIDDQQIASLLGRSVHGPTGEDMGRVVDVLVDTDGALRAAVIDFGGFFGVGSRKIAIDWHALHFGHDAKGARIVADLPQNQLRVAPIYKEGEPVVVIGRAPEAAPPSEPAAGAPAAPPASAPAASPPTPEPAVK